MDKLCTCDNCPSAILTAKVWRYPVLRRADARDYKFGRSTVPQVHEKLFFSWGDKQEPFGSWTEAQAIAIYNAIGEAVPALQ